MRARLFTDGELAVAAGRTDPIPALAVRFAAKEAVMKALGVGLGAFSFHEVEVVRLESGAPELRVTGAAAALAAGAGGDVVAHLAEPLGGHRRSRGQRPLATHHGALNAVRVREK